MPQWAGSCWYYLRYLDPLNRDRFVDPDVEKFWMRGSGEDGLVYEGERVRRQHGKMGKSLKNSVSPDQMYEAYGADTLRMYEMSMGPLDADRPWQPDDIVGVYRFLQRLWRNVVDEQTGEPRPAADPLPGTDPLYRLAHRTIDDVTKRFAEL